MSEFITQDDSELNVIFIHSKLDEIGLTANQFRIYAHLSRRAHSAGKAWPGVDSMASVCRMHKETVIEAIRQLEGLQMIQCDRQEGKRTVYKLTPPSVWAVGNGERSNQSEMGNGAVGTGERHLSEQGNVRKSKEGNPKKECAAKPLSTAESIIEGLRDNPAYKGINLDRELGKMKAWLQTPKGTRRKLNHAFIVNWLNKVDPELPHEKTNGSSSSSGHNSGRNAGTFNAGGASAYAGIERLAGASQTQP